MLKKIACSILAVMLITTQAFALSGKMTGGFPDKSTFQHTADDYQAQQRAGYGYLPQGLTFYKDFTKIPAGTYSNAVMGNLLNADYSIGSSVATFTSTSGSFTISANGYHATTANDEVLKYLTSGNFASLTATVIISFVPDANFSNDGTAQKIFDTDTSRIIAEKIATDGYITFSNGGSNAVVSTTVPQQNITYVAGLSFQPTGNPNKVLYVAGLIQGTPNNTDISSTHGDYFWVACNILGASQFVGKVKKICIFNRVLSANEHLTVKGLM